MYTLRALLQVRLLARNPDKVPKVLATVFDEAEVEKHQENVHVVKVSNIISTHYLHIISTQYLHSIYTSRVQGGAGDEDAVAELLEGADVVLSFLGMVDPKLGPVVRPGVEHIIAGLKKVAAGEMILRRHQSHQQ